MILKALYDYYDRCGDLPAEGMELKEIGFLIVLSKEGKFLRFEDCRKDSKTAGKYLVKKHVGKTSSIAANYLYDNSDYVLGYSNKEDDKVQERFDAFKKQVAEIYEIYPDNKDLQAVHAFYEQGREAILSEIEKDSLWLDIKKNLSKKYSTFSFRIDGDKKIVAEKKEILQLDKGNDVNEGKHICLISGERGKSCDTTTATMIPGSQATAKLVAFQVNSGYDSYGKAKCGNAPISTEAEFKYTTALNTMLGRDSHNKFLLGNRTFVFWASSNNNASSRVEESIFTLLGFDADPKKDDDPNSKIEKVKKVFTSIYSGELKTDLDDRFYILGLAPNAARIAVVYWSESPLKEFAGKLLAHFEDMEICDTRKEKKPYMGLREILSAVTLGGKQSEAMPNLPEAVAKSIFQGLPYPFTLFSSCIRRIRAEQNMTITRAAIIKAYLIRKCNEKISNMLDKDNLNQGYLCGRLFAVLDKIQEEANNIHSIRERYMNAASATPAAVFATILNLSSHHAEKLNEGRKISFEKLKQEIFDKFPADGFPTHLDLQDQGRFFVGYYHQRQDFFISKKDNSND